MMRWTIVSLLVSTAPAARKESRRRQSDVERVPVATEPIQQSEAGMVDGLFTFGAPGVSAPALTNPRDENGCFPGLRLWTSVKGGFPSYRTRNDWVVPIAGGFGFKHPQIGGADLHMTKDKDAKTVTFQDCSEELTDLPAGGGLPGGGSTGWLHEQDTYVDGARLFDDDAVLNMTILATKFSYNRDPTEEVAAGVREYGWRLVGSGFEEGKNGGGPQVSHLLQNPASLDCIITFQGSASLGDWLANINARKVNFCGFPSKVHMGFRDHMRRMVRTPSWQEGVRANLGQCANIYVTGHSLGGAMATLFAACTANAPSSGAGYDDDYSFIGWQKQSAARMQYK